MATSKPLKNKKLWLKVFTEHCHRDVTYRYHQLTEDHQKQQFLTVLRDNVLTYNRLLPKEEIEKCIVYEVKPDSYYVSLTDAIRSEDIEPNRAALDELPSHLGELSRKYMKLLVHSQNVQFMKQAVLSNKTFTYTIITSHKDYSHRTVNFSCLKKILFKDLCFGTANGCYIEGKLITEASVSTGVTTFMEDETGQYMMIGLYNVIPEHQSRNEVAATKFPFGTRIRIAEPFYKTFMDGNVGVRVDAPSDLEILKDYEGDGIDLKKVREDAKKFFINGSHLEALQTYWSALCSFSVVR